MRESRKWLRRGTAAGMMAAVLSMGGCAGLEAPVIGPGLRIGLSPGGSLDLASCSLLGTPGVGSPSARTSSAAAVAFSRMQQVSQVQSRFSLASSDIRAQMGRWKMAAERDC